MLLTITNTQAPATDLGYLLHKNPARAQSFDLAVGRAHVFYPEATADRCTAALLLDIDPIGMVRGRRGPPGEGRTLDQYVNDRPYVASSFMSVAIAQVFGSALAGRCKDRPELVETPLPLEATLAVLPCRGGEPLLRRLFEPLGYAVTAQGHPLDEAFAEWGASCYFNVRLCGRHRLSDLLGHLYVLIPVLDNDKHYWVGDDEVKKLLRHGEGWLKAHPERELIALRYLKHRRSLAREALAQLTEGEDLDEAAETHANEEADLEGRLSLNEQRMGAVVAVLKQSGAKRILDLGCGEGRLLGTLLDDKEFDEIVGLDVSYRALEKAQDRLHLDWMAPKKKAKLKLVHGSLMYRDKRIAGYDAAVVVEVIEHLDPARLAAFERVVFEFAKPTTIVVTTPNGEYNVKFENLPAGKLRHKDHRFEWSRVEFEAWAKKIGERFAYRVRFLPVGPVDPTVGAPTQMGVFTRV